MTNSDDTAPGGNEAPTTEQPTAPTAPPDRTESLMRSSDDRVIAGVCGGVAEWLGVDVRLVRVVTVVLAFVGGATILAYLAAILLLPENDGTGKPSERVAYRRLSQIVGAGLLGVAALLIVGASVDSDNFGLIWSIGGLGVALVLAFLLLLVGRRLLAPAGTPRSTPPVAKFFGAFLVGFGVLIGLGAVAAVSAAATALAGPVPAAIVVLALGVVMLGLTLANQRALWLAAPALAIAAPALLLGAGDIRFPNGSVGERRYVPTSVAALQDEYELGVGGMQIDLRRLKFPTDGPAVVRLNLGAGEARIVVPSEVCVRSESRVRAGEELLLGSSSQGLSIDEPRGYVGRWPGKQLLVQGEVDLGRLVVTEESWDQDSDFPDVDDRISPAMAAAGCAGAIR